MTVRSAGALVDRKVVVVLGAGQGVGAASARLLAAHGATVICVGRRSGPTEQIAQEVDGTAFVGDASTRPDLVRLVESVAASHGGFDGVVNVIGMGIRTTPSEITMDDLRWQFANVLDSTVLTLDVLGQQLAARDHGSVVLIGSIAARRVVAGQGLYAYSGAKAALEQMARIAAVELGPSGVRVNVVAPGLTTTPRVRSGWSLSALDRAADAHPLRRLADPNDVAGAVLFLLSDLARHVTGAVIAVDGGMSAITPVLAPGRSEHE